MPDPLVVFESILLHGGGGRVVFDELDWSLPRGARARIVGNRGAGGSAILRLVAGLAHPEKGRILLAGVPHAPFQFDHPFIRRGAVAWIPEDGGLIANLTLLENVALPMRFVLGARRTDAEDRALAMLDRLDLASHAALRPHALDRTERELGALARSAVMGAELWLLDRPFDDLEGPRLSCAMRLLDEALADSSRTLLVVGDGPAYRKLAPRTIRLEAGRLIEENEA